MIANVQRFFFFFFFSPHFRNESVLFFFTKYRNLIQSIFLLFRIIFFQNDVIFLSSTYILLFCCLSNLFFPNIVKDRNFKTLCNYEMIVKKKKLDGVLYREFWCAVSLSLTRLSLVISFRTTNISCNYR